ncbi:hypothetical protein LTR62_004185 [Meristemomyces frigidus]|uniref:Rab-GAP TBC domain-containing protein n=1 Tax=Meristemomyces frigidus TaxID=1508187 RepID=A0AAN7TP35_9PEZI|nr:hypothetical protein LTR62_004185 [Meristemomyces frigidus]
MTSRGSEVNGSLPPEELARPPSSPLMQPPATPSTKPGKKLRSSRSLGDGLRGIRQRISSSKSTSTNGRETPDSIASPPSLADGEVRQSFRSAFTNHSSYLNSSINTEQSSLIDGHSSTSEFVNVYPHWPETEDDRASMTVDDAIGMYADGFESAKPSMDTYRKRSLQLDRGSVKDGLDNYGKRSLQVERSASQPKEEYVRRPNLAHRRSQSASLLNQWKTLSPGLPARQQSVSSNPTVTGVVTAADAFVPASDGPTLHAVVPRDRYGFKKASHYITVAQYDAWDAAYSQHLERRSKKWQILMRSYGLSTDRPVRFPPKSDKIKRYVRKGIPPEYRGAAWFWYAGGPSRLAKVPGLYQNLLNQVENGELTDNDREHIERDLNRTFPDNIRFKPDVASMADVQAGAGGGKNSRLPDEPETSMVQSLRRLLQAFAVHNPGIGYCQSLNFIAGLLLLFLDQDEEKSFILLEVITSVHLPGTHGIALEGANIDIAVLMSCVKDSLPEIWKKLDDKGGMLGSSNSTTAADAATQALRLPTVSLATTAWFMSLFVGTLPIESVLRVWDCLFLEGSRTLFRIALAVFKAGEREILAVSDPMEIFQVVQTIPRGMLDVNGLMEGCFRRRGGFGHVSQEGIERRREERRREVRRVGAGVGAGNGDGGGWRGRWRSRTKV